MTTPPPGTEDRYTQDPGTPQLPHTHTARFHPQAWHNNYAIDVDPEGPTIWTVTPEWINHIKNTVGPDRYNAIYESSDVSDLVRDDPGAPTWIRNWPGPYWVEIDGPLD